MAIGRSQDPYQLSEKVVPHLEVIFKAPISTEKSEFRDCVDSKHLMIIIVVCVCMCPAGFEKLEWESFAIIMEALLGTLHGFTTFMQVRTMCMLLCVAVNAVLCGAVNALLSLPPS